ESSRAGGRAGAAEQQARVRRGGAATLSAGGPAGEGADPGRVLRRDGVPSRLRAAAAGPAPAAGLGPPAAGGPGAAVRPGGAGPAARLLGGQRRELLQAAGAVAAGAAGAGGGV